MSEMTLKSTITEFDAYLGNKESILDKNYQRIAEQIKLLWGYDEFFMFVEKLVLVEKERNRGGFPYEVILELNALQDIHRKNFAKRAESLNKSKISLKNLLGLFSRKIRKDFRYTNSLPLPTLFLSDVWVHSPVNL